MALDLDLIQQENAATARDLTKPIVLGDFKPPEAGPTRLRLVGYVETGTHLKTFGKDTKEKAQVELTFELSGPKHQPRKLDDGTQIPFRIVVKENLGFTAKNGYMKLFGLMNYNNDHTNFVSMLMREYWRGNVSHREYEVGGQKRVAAGLKDNGVYEIKAPTFQDPETGEERKVTAGPALTAPRLFLWDSPSLDMWDSLYIGGEYDNGDTKNVLQEKIKAALNFEGSPIWDLLKENGRTDELLRAKNANTTEDPPEVPEKDEEAKPASKAPVAKGPAAKGAVKKADAKPAAAKVVAKKVDPKADPLADEVGGDDPFADDDIPF